MPGIARPRFGALLLTVLALTLLAACGADEDDPTPTASGGGSAPTATADPGPTATEGEDQVALDGTAWLLEGMNGVEMDLQVPITLAFEDGRVSGYAGCNDYGGAYTVNPDGSFSIPEIEQTDMACESGMELEAEYLGTLQQAARYSVIEGSRLELANSAGEAILVFTSDVRLPLDGTSWSVTELNGEPVIAGTDIHFMLRAGEISGSGGCNQFGGQYAADASGAFSASELFWTEMGCIEPAGAMEQEQAFFEALAAVTTYQHDTETGTLTLLDAEGQPRIVTTTRDEQAGASIFGSPGWVLTSLGGEALDGDLLVTLFLEEDTEFAGNVGCLSYGGLMEITPDGDITRVSVAPSDASCGETGIQSDVPERYIAALGAAATYRTAGDALELQAADGTVLAFRPGMADPALEDAAWTLVSMNDKELVPDTEITLEFYEDYAGGTGGCNGYGSSYVIAEAGVIAIPAPVRTAMGCLEPPGVQEQEEEFFTLLPRVRAYQITESGLELSDSQGNIILAFAATTPLHRRELVDTSWTLIELNLEEPIPGSQITLDISEEMMTGNGGCNGYGVQSYAHPGPGVIELGEIAFEEKACAEPAGVMEQESAYGDALQAVTAYALDGQRLMLFDARGTMVLMFEQRM